MKSKVLILTGILVVMAGFQTPAQQTLGLEQCRQMALEHNQKIAIAKENCAAATSLRKAAFTQFLPDFGFTGGYTHSTKELSLLSESQFLPVVPYTAITAEGTIDPGKLTANDIVINPVTHQPVLDKNGNPVFQKYSYIPKDAFSIDLRNIYSLNFGVTQPIFTGGKILNLYKSAKTMERMAWAAQSLETSELLYKVDEHYWRVVAVEEKVKLAMAYQKMLARLIEDLQNYSKEGMIITNDLLKAQVKENEAELALMKANNGLVLAKMALCQVIGLPLDALIVTRDSLTPSPILHEPANPMQAALENRSEITLLKEQVNLANAGVNMMKSRFLPDIGLAAGYGWMNPSPYSGFTKNFEGDLNIAIVCKIPLWHWGERMHTLHAAQHEQKVSELKLAETEELVSLQVKQAQFQYLESVKKTELTEKSLGQANVNLQVTNDKFAEGILKTTDVLESQTMWQKAYSETIDAKTESKIYNSYLKKVTGEIQQINK